MKEYHYTEDFSERFIEVVGDLPMPGVGPEKGRTRLSIMQGTRSLRCIVAYTGEQKDAEAFVQKWKSGKSRIIKAFPKVMILLWSLLFIFNMVLAALAIMNPPVSLFVLWYILWMIISAWKVQTSCRDIAVISEIIDRISENLTTENKEKFNEVSPLEDA